MPVLGAVVDVDDVEAVEPGALVAVLEGADRAGGGVVEGAAEGQRMGKALAHLARLRCGVEQPADLGGERIGVARARAQRVAQPVLGQPGAVMRRGVVVPDAHFPGGAEAGGRLVLRHGSGEIAERRAARAQRAMRLPAGHFRSSGGMTPLVSRMLP